MKILCRVVGGGKILKGDAQPGDVLIGKTFSNHDDNKWTGTMPNNGDTSHTNDVTIDAGAEKVQKTVTDTIPYGFTKGGTITTNITVNPPKGKTATLNGRSIMTGTVYNLGTGTSFNVKSLMSSLYGITLTDSDLSAITASNFIVSAKTMSAEEHSSTPQTHAYVYDSLNWDATTGELTVSASARFRMYSGGQVGNSAFDTYPRDSDWSAAGALYITFSYECYLVY